MAMTTYLQKTPTPLTPHHWRWEGFDIFFPFKSVSEGRLPTLLDCFLKN